MKITFEADLLIPPFSETLSFLTNGAKVCVDDIHYDEAKGTVNLYMQRKEITGFKKSFFGQMQPVYDQTMIKSLLTIRQVEEMNIRVDDRLIEDCNSCFTALFGVKLDEKQLSLSSVEEVSGITMCQIYIKVKEMSIEFGDDVKE